jgi:peptidase E
LRNDARARHIVAIGGGGFNRDPESLAVERYMLRLTRVRRASVCFVPTASAEPADYIARFEAAFERLGARTSVLRFFDRTPDVRELLLSQDVIYVGGGNTKSMLAVWREWDVPGVLRDAWRRGIVLGGVSAGAICWFDMGVTDSWAGHLAPLPCLGLLPATCCPHYDSEADRRPSVHEFVARGIVPPVLALEDGSAAHFVGRRLHAVVTWKPSARGYRVKKLRGEVVETALPAVRLRGARNREAV